MSFVGLLRPELIALDPPWHGFADTVAGLVATLAATGALARTQEADAVRAVVAREREQSTAVPEIEVGVPHARVHGLTRTVVALAISGEGLYEPVPTVRIRIVALVLSPTGATDDHLRVLAGIATLLRSPDLRASLVAASSADAAFGILGAHARSAP